MIHLEQVGLYLRTSGSGLEPVKGQNLRTALEYSNN